MKLVAELGPDVTTEIEVARFERDEESGLADLELRLEVVLAAMPPADATLTCAAWEAWQDGLAERFTLPADLPPLRILLVWDNLTGHKNVGMVLWLCQQGIMPLYTPLGGSWLNMAESIQRILKRRTLDGQHPQNPTEIGT